MQSDRYVYKASSKKGIGNTLCLMLGSFIILSLKYTTTYIV